MSRHLDNCGLRMFLAASTQILQLLSTRIVTKASIVSEPRYLRRSKTKSPSFTSA